MPIMYEKLPDFCFCCAHIGHQYRECLNYKGQQKEDLPYGGWMRATTQAKRVKQNWNRERVNRELFQSKANVTIASSPKSHQNQHNPLGKTDHIRVKRV